MDHFNSETYRGFAESWKFDHTTSSPHYPQSNGFIERCIQTVKTTLKKAKDSDLDPYMALLCLRSTPIDHTIASPGELLYTRKLRGNLPAVIRNPINNKDDIQMRLKGRQETQKMYYDRNAHDLSQLTVGQSVQIQDQTTNLWIPATIEALCDEPRSYIVKTSSGHTLRRNRQHIQIVAPTVRKTLAHSDENRNPHAGYKRPPDKEQRPKRPEPSVYRTRSGRPVSKPKRLDIL